MQPTGSVDPFRVREAAQRTARASRTRNVELDRCAAIAAQLRAELASHPKQEAFFYDPSPQAAALCTRQAGKTRADATLLLDTALTKPGSYSVYVNTSKDECRNILWDNPDDVGLLSTIDRLGIPCETNDTRMTIRVPATGSRIKLVGVDDKAEVKKLRGPTYDCAIVDEAQGIPYLEPLAIGALLAGTVKRKGILRLTGTPGEVCEGLYYNITRDDGGALPGWAVHRWTIYDNPGIPHAREYVEAIKAQNGWADDNEIYLREFCGKWVTAHRLLVYQLAAVPQAKRYYIDLPGGSFDWRYVVGVDLGFYPDPFAVVVWAYCDDLPVLYEIESSSYESLNTEQQAGILARLVEKYQPERMVCDAGSGGLKQIVVGDWQQRFGLPVDVAQKEQKDSAIDMFNSDLVAGRVLLREGSLLDRQMLILPWKDQIGAKRVEDVHRNGGRFRNDACDAGLYAYRETPFFEGRLRTRGPWPGTPGYELAQMDAHKDHLVRAMSVQQLEDDELLGDLDDEGGGPWHRRNR